jgi:hypothetical protein
MKKLKSIFAAVAAVAALGVAGSAKAAINYYYTTYNGSAVTVYQATAGTPITIPVYLYEKLTSSSPSVISADGGLAGAGFSVTQSTNTGTGTLTSIAGSTSSNGSSFSGGSTTTPFTNTSTYKDIANAGSLSSFGAGPTPTNGFIQIGSITITTSATNTYKLGWVNYPSASSEDDTGTWGTGPSDGSGFDLDANGGSSPYTYTGAIADGPETFMVSVPEPASATLIGIGALGLLARRRKAEIA